ncbi:segregation/condensation protein A [Candidatus Micrarchaeota archaeon]|nr:segregation/condensation protein A [Candidatus Micrarchaeota archaeon]
MQNSVVLGDTNLVSLIDIPEWKSILLDLVSSEKMDPWNIDIILLSEKYLQKINSMEKMDLRVPANAILASSILLRAKAKLLKIPSIEEETEKNGVDKIIEEFIPELKDMRTLREGKISLDELVDAIESIVEQTKTKKMKLREMPELKFHVPVAGENITEKMKKVYARIKELADSQGLVLFSNLTENLNDHLIETFIPLLFLNDEDKINLWQEEWFGEIFISLVK